jgi:hypothetical protein
VSSRLSKLVSDVIAESELEISFEYDILSEGFAEETPDDKIESFVIRSNVNGRSSSRVKSNDESRLVSDE